MESRRVRSLPLGVKWDIKIPAAEWGPRTFAVPEWGPGWFLREGPRMIDCIMSRVESEIKNGASTKREVRLGEYNTLLIRLRSGTEQYSWVVDGQTEHTLKIFLIGPINVREERYDYHVATKVAYLPWGERFRGPEMAALLSRSRSSRNYLSEEA